MIDVSDGLAGDVRHIARASSVALEVDVESVPVQAGVSDVAAAADADATSVALGGGEDYELLVAVAPERLETARAGLDELGVTLTEIGRVLAEAPGGDVVFKGAGGEPVEVRGYDQLRASGGPPGRG
jgi:thiamine-monophosphate kinase